MRRKTKRILIFTIILICILVALPYIMGIVVERQYKNIVAKIDKNPDITLQLINYHRGWFCSQAIIKIIFAQHPKALPSLKINPLLSVPGELAFTFRERIKHGPLIIDGSLFLARASIHSELILSEEQRKTFAELSSVIPKVKTDTVIELGGDIFANIEVARFAYKTGQFALECDMAKAFIRSDKNLEKITTDFYITGLGVRYQKLKLVIPATRFKQMGIKTNEGKWHWTRNGDIDSVTVSQKGQKDITVDGIKIANDKVVDFKIKKMNINKI